MADDWPDRQAGGSEDDFGSANYGSDFDDRGLQQPKQGMSTAVKVLLVLGIIAVLFGCLCCGGVIWVASRQKVSEDPQETRETAREILGTDVPDELFAPVATINFDMFVMTMKMAVFTVKGAEGEMFIMEMNVPQQDGGEQAMENALRQQSPQNQRALVVESSEAKSITVRGQEVDFLFVKGKDNAGKAFREVRGTFTGNTGTVLLILQIEESAYDEGRIIEFLESIQ